MSDVRAVEACQLSQLAEPHQPQTNVGYFEPLHLDDLGKQGRLYLISEPLSGTASGQVACRYAIHKILHSFYKTKTGDLKEQLLKAIRQANADILERNSEHPERRPMAITLTAALIHENKLLVANVGDNQVYVVWDQDIELLNHESSPIETAENGESSAGKDGDIPVPLLPAKIEVPPAVKPKLSPAKSATAVVRLPDSLGLETEIDIEIFSRRLFAGDVVVLCSGGLAGYVKEKEIARAVNQHAPEQAIKRLISLAGERGNRDPIAASVTRVLSGPAATRPPVPMTLPPSPHWDDLEKTPLPSDSGNQRSSTSPDIKTATQPLGQPRILPSSAPTGALPTFVRKPAEDAPKENERNLGWKVYILAVVAFLCACAVPVLAWEYLIPTEMLASVPVLGNFISDERDESEPAGEAAANEANSNAQVGQALPTITPTQTALNQTETAPVTESNSSISTPDTVFESPVTTPTAAPNQSGGQSAADTVVVLITPSPTPLPLPTIVVPPDCENRARFVRDITIPDGSQFSPGESFEKAWSVLNADSCPWGPGYTVRFIDGDLMGAGPTIPLLDVVSPDSNGEIRIPMVAPAQAGTYRGEWQLHDLDGEPFGPDLYLEIEVGSSSAASTVTEAAGLTTLYDFVKNVGEASWSSGALTYTPQAASINESLELPSPEGLVASGIAQLRGNKESESNVLLTYPHRELGYIEGVYNVDIPLQPDDTLVANVGFTKLSILSDDGVTFEVIFSPSDGSGETVIMSNQVQYRDSPVSEVVPLTNIQPGQTGTFTVRTEGGESLNQDWAIWLDLRLARSE